MIAYLSNRIPGLQVWKLSATDLCEVARNSVLHSGFPHQVRCRLTDAWLTRGCRLAVAWLPHAGDAGCS